MILTWTPHPELGQPSLTFDPNLPADATGLKLLDRDGFEASAGTPESTAALGRAGETVLGVRVPGRVISISAMLITQSRADYWAWRSALSASLATPSDGVYPGTLTLDRTDEGVAPRVVTIAAIPRESPRTDRLTNLADNVDIEWVCPEPHFRGENEEQYGFTVDQPGGLTFPLTFPLTWPASDYSISFTADNSGTAVTWPRFVLTGPLVNVRLLNNTTRRAMNVAYSIGSGETLVVDMEPGSRRVDVESGGVVTPLAGYLSADSRYWGLQRGANSITIEVDSTTGGSGAMYWRPAYAGL